MVLLIDNKDLLHSEQFNRWKLGWKRKQVRKEQREPEKTIIFKERVFYVTNLQTIWEERGDSTKESIREVCLSCYASFIIQILIATTGIN